MIGALLAVAGIVLIGLAIGTTHQNCPASTYNGTGPPPPTAPCAANSWTALALSTLALGIVLVPSGGFVALYRRS